MEIFKNPLTVSMENFIIRQTDRQTGATRQKRKEGRVI